MTQIITNPDFFNPFCLPKIYKLALGDLDRTKNINAKVPKKAVIESTNGSVIIDIFTGLVRMALSNIIFG